MRTHTIPENARRSASEDELNSFWSSVDKFELAGALGQENIRQLCPELVSHLERQLSLVEVGDPGLADLGHRLGRPFEGERRLEVRHGLEDQGLRDGPGWPARG